MAQTIEPLARPRDVQESVEVLFRDLRSKPGG